MQRIVVIGAGHASGQLLDSLRRGGSDAHITLVGEESWLPYQRPPLSKRFLSGELTVERLAFRPKSFYEKHDIHTRLSCRAVSIDRDAQTVRLANGEALDYDLLALTTGGRVRKLSVPGAGLTGVHYLRGIDDALGLQADWQGRDNVCVIGGGFVGLEVAASARRLGKNVTVIEMMDRLMGRAVSPAMSGYFLGLHTRNGSHVMCSTGVSELVGTDGRVSGVRLSDGREIPADVVVVGIGVLPNQELAREAGLACDNGIMVDEFARTSDPKIVSAGDCTNHPNSLLGKRLRLESVHNALEQAKSAAASLMGGQLPYAQVPWFWSDQYNSKLQMVGLSQGFDFAVQRGNPDEDKFSLFYYRGNALIAIDSVNCPGDHMGGKKLIAAGISPSPGQAADPEFPLKSLL